jgi:hypothetical protein
VFLLLLLLLLLLLRSYGKLELGFLFLSFVFSAGGREGAEVNAKSSLDFDPR